MVCNIAKLTFGLKSSLKSLGFLHCHNHNGYFKMSSDEKLTNDKRVSRETYNILNILPWLRPTIRSGFLK